MKPPTASPMYVLFFPELSEIAREHGYALAVHGSVARDFDLVCVPWAPFPAEPIDVVRAIEERFSFRSQDTFTEKCHGRQCIIMAMGPAFVDLSFMPRLTKPEHESWFYGSSPDRTLNPKGGDSDV